MKKQFVLIIMTICLVLATASGCNGSPRGDLNKNDLAEFDNQVWVLSEELKLQQEEHGKRIQAIPAEKILDLNEPDIGFLIENISFNIDCATRLLEAENDNLAHCIGSREGLKNLRAPEPLQEFYDKKLEQLDKLAAGNQRKIDGVENHLKFLEEFKKAAQKRFIAAGTEMNAAIDFSQAREKMYRESDQILKEAEVLDQECSQIFTAVYQSYRMDDLLEKWQ